MHNHHANIGLQLSVFTRNTAGSLEGERHIQSSSQAILISSDNTFYRVISSTHRLCNYQISPAKIAVFYSKELEGSNISSAIHIHIHTHTQINIDMYTNTHIFSHTHGVERNKGA